MGGGREEEVGEVVERALERGGEYFGRLLWERVCEIE